MLLEVSVRERPDSATTIYRPDFDLAALKDQLREVSAELKKQVDAGNVTLEVRDPTQSLLAALIVNLAAYEARFDIAQGTMQKLAGNLGRDNRDVGLDFANRRIGINVEEYQPSAYKSQVSFDITSLPA